MRRSARAYGWWVSTAGGASAARILWLTVFSTGLVLPGSASAAQEPSGSKMTHEVSRGDTLWELARRFLANPFLWPQIYQLNTDVVEDPHWIYPGEFLRLPLGVAATKDATQISPATVTAVRIQTRTAGVELPVQERRGVSGFGGTSIFDTSPNSGDILGSLGVEEFIVLPLVSPSDFLRASFLADPTTVGPMAVTARKIEANPLELSLPLAIRQHHRVVLSLNGISTEVGEWLQAIHWRHRIGTHGRVVTPVALLEVLSIQGDSARAEVLAIYGPYVVGDPVLPAEAFEFDPTSQPVPTESDLLVDVIGLDVEQVLVGLGDMLFLDAGSQAGLRLGDDLVVFSSRETDAAGAAFEDRLAVIRVVRLRPATATAMVVGVKDAGVSSGSPARLVTRAAGG